VLVALKGHIEKKNILSYGQNHYTTNEKSNYTIHAEIDALNKLPTLKNKEKKEKINMLVCRFSKGFKLGNSKPCFSCVKKMCIDFPKKGYILQKIYYSNDDGTIEKTTLTKLVYDNPKKKEFALKKFY